MVREGGVVKGDALAILPHAQCIPKELYDELRNSKDPLSHWFLGSPYALPNDAPEEVEVWGRRMQERVLNTLSIFDKQRIRK